MNQFKMKKKHLKKIQRYLHTFLMILFFTGIASAKEYYVSTNGNNNSSGTINSPLRTIAYATGKVFAGDVIYVRAGIYSESFEIKKSGTSENNRIILRNYKDELVSVIGNGKNYYSCAISGNWVTVQGLNFKYRNPEKIGHVANVMIHGDHVTIYKCKFIGNQPIVERKAGAREAGIRFEATKYTVIDDCYITGLSHQGINIQDKPAFYWIVRNTYSYGNHSNGIMLSSQEAAMQYGLVQNCTLGGSLSSDGFQTNGDYKNLPPTTWGIMLDNNIMYGSVENGIDPKGARHIFVQNNIVYHNQGDNDGINGNTTEHDRSGNTGIGRGTGTWSKDMVLRGNIVYANCGGVSLESNIRSPKDEHEYFYFYNNTVVGNNYDYTTTPSSPTSIFTPPKGKGLFGNFSAGWSNHVYFKNNIVGGSKNVDVIFNNTSLNTSDYNLYANDITTPRISHVVSKSGNKVFTIPEWKKNSAIVMKGGDKHSRVADPKFRNTSSRPTGIRKRVDFTPNIGSEAIDNGGWLTQTNGSGSGSSVKVDQPGYFHGAEGWSEIGISGDKIMIGNKEAVIKSIQGKTLNLDRSISWSNDAPVIWCPNGDCPKEGKIDIGAKQTDDDNALPLKITTKSLPNGEEGLAYNQTLTAENGTSPYSWSILNGSLSDGLSLNTNGTISGTLAATATGISSFTIRVQDTSGNTDDLALTITTQAAGVINLANGNTHTGDSKNFLTGYGPENLWDGTTASTGNKEITSFWVEYDLGQLYDISLIRFSGDDGGNWVSRAYSVLVKDNLSDAYTPLIDHANAFTLVPIETTSETLTTRYIRLEVFNPVSPFSVQANEFEVFGKPAAITNLANGNTHTGDSKNFLTGYGPENLWDETTAATGNKEITSFWVEYDLGQLYDISLIRFSGDDEGNWVSRAYSVLVKKNQSDTYTALIDHADAFTLAPIETTPSSLTTRYIRLEVFNPVSPFSVQVNEFEVFGTPTTNPIALNSISQRLVNTTPVDFVSAKINASPNPAKEKLTISDSPTSLKINKTDQGTVQIELYTLTGEKVYRTTNVTLPHQIDTSTYLPGIYVLKVVIGDSYVIQKILKE